MDSRPATAAGFVRLNDEGRPSVPSLPLATMVRPKSKQSPRRRRAYQGPTSGRKSAPLRSSSTAPHGQPHRSAEDQDHDHDHTQGQHRRPGTQSSAVRGSATHPARRPASSFQPASRLLHSSPPAFADAASIDSASAPFAVTLPDGGRQRWFGTEPKPTGIRRPRSALISYSKRSLKLAGEVYSGVHAYPVPPSLGRQSMSQYRSSAKAAFPKQTRQDWHRTFQYRDVTMDAVPMFNDPGMPSVGQQLLSERATSPRACIPRSPRMARPLGEETPGPSVWVPEPTVGGNPKVGFAKQLRPNPFPGVSESPGPRYSLASHRGPGKSAPAFSIPKSRTSSPRPGDGLGRHAPPNKYNPPHRPSRTAPAFSFSRTPRF